MLFYSSSDPVIRASQLEAMEREERERKRKFARRHLVLSGDHKELVREEVRRIFRDPRNAEKVSTLYDVSCNVARQVVEEIYRYPGASRRFVLESGEADPVYAQLVTDLINVDLYVAEGVFSVGGLNDCLFLVLPGPVGEDGIAGPPTIRVFRPHECSVIPYEDDPGRPAVVFYEQQRASGERVTVVWTPTEHYVLDARKRIQPAPGASGIENPFGRLPFVAMHGGLRSDCFWDESSRQDLFDFTLQYSAHWSAFNHLRHYCSFAQPVVTGLRKGDDFKRPSTLDPAQVWELPDGVTATTMALSADFTGYRESLKAQVGQMVGSWGLQVEDFFGNPGQAPPSGLAHVFKRIRLSERRARLYPFVEEAEYELADALRWAWNWNHSEKISETARFEVAIQDDPVRLTPLEQEELRMRRLERLQREINLGLRTRAEVIAEERGIGVAAAEALATQPAAAGEGSG